MNVARPAPDDFKSSKPTNKIIIATNGPIVPLKTKIDKIKISQFVDFVFSAEEIGVMKPHRGFYDALFKNAKIIESDKILFIGDQLEQDIKGAIENNMDTCWCNYKNEINNTEELQQIENTLETIKSRCHEIKMENYTDIILIIMA